MVIWIGFIGYVRVYAGPRDEIEAQISDVQSAVDQYASALDGRKVLDRRVQAYVNRTLGGDRETVDHRLRTRLNRIAEEMQLDGVTVGTGRATDRSTPAGRAFARQRELRDEVDFTELAGWIAAEGTLEQALQLVHRVQSEPWLKRIDQTKLDPKDNGATVEVTVRLTTIFLPGHEPDGSALPASNGEGFERFAGLVNVNPFRVPEAPAVVAAPTPSVSPPGPPAFRYDQWRLTGLAQGPAGWEVWLRNGVTGESRRLEPGQQLSEAVFVGARAGQAVFQIGETQFSVALGARLDDRTPVDR
ncbi:MAG: hypothetical protein ACYTGP_09035 [Planctomycetota bacterium]